MRENMISSRLSCTIVSGTYRTKEGNIYIYNMGEKENARLRHSERDRYRKTENAASVCQ